MGSVVTWWWWGGGGSQVSSVVVGVGVDLLCVWETVEGSGLNGDCL